MTSYISSTEIEPLVKILICALKCVRLVYITIKCIAHVYHMTFSPCLWLQGFPSDAARTPQSRAWRLRSSYGRRRGRPAAHTSAISPGFRASLLGWNERAEVPKDRQRWRFRLSAPEVYHDSCQNGHTRRGGV